MKRGDKVTIRFADTCLEDAIFLGAGTFCKAYRVGDTVWCFVRGCYLKDAIAMWGDATNPHVPTIERVDLSVDVRFRRSWKAVECDIYTMPYYETLSASHREAWVLFKALKDARERAYDEIIQPDPHASLARDGFRVNDRTIELADVPDTMKQALRSIADAIATHGSGCVFEFSKANLGVDAEDRLILRDIAFDVEQQQRLYLEEAKRRRARAGC